MTHEELCSNANLASVAVALSLLLTSLVPFFSFLKTHSLNSPNLEVSGWMCMCVCVCFCLCLRESNLSQCRCHWCPSI